MTRVRAGAVTKVKVRAMLRFELVARDRARTVVRVWPRLRVRAIR